MSASTPLVSWGARTWVLVSNSATNRRLRVCALPALAMPPKSEPEFQMLKQIPSRKRCWLIILLPLGSGTRAGNGGLHLLLASVLVNTSSVKPPKRLRLSTMLWIAMIYSAA